jgi:hypothetical protein
MDRKSPEFCLEFDCRTGQARRLTVDAPSSWTRRLTGRRLRAAAALLAVLGLGVVAPRHAGAQGTGRNAGLNQEPVSSQDQTKPSEPLGKPDQTGRDATPADAPGDPVPASDEALSARYRFIETYAVADDPAHPEVVTTYQVGVGLKRKTVTERRQGAPVIEETAQGVIYTERPAKVDRRGEVVEAIRRYDVVNLGLPAGAYPFKPPLLQGLTIWYERRTVQQPFIMSLTDNHPLREPEYIGIVGQIFLPALTSFLPPKPARVGDSWKIPLKAAHFLVSEEPDPKDYEMNATLQGVKKESAGPTLTAVIGLLATVNLPIRGSCATNAQIRFSFEPPPAAAPPAAFVPGEKPDDTVTRPTPAKRSEPGIVEARGRISYVGMAMAATTDVADSDGRLKQTVTYELRMGRRPLAPKYGPLNVPETRPTPDEANSWLTHDDPARQFHFQHPQDLEIVPSDDPDLLELVDPSPAGKDVFVIHFPPGPEDQEAIVRFRKTDQFKRDIEASWSARKQQTILGPEGWLPEDEWRPLKVYRKELAGNTSAMTVPGKNTSRIYIDYYLVLGKHNTCLRVHSLTNRDDHVAFRKIAESMIKSIQFGPATEALAPPTGAPASAPATVPANTPASAPAAPPIAPPGPPQ